MANLDPRYGERLAVVEKSIDGVTKDLNSLASLRDIVHALKGRLDEKDRQESVFWAKYGVYATIAAAIAGTVAGVLGTLVALGKL